MSEREYIRKIAYIVPSETIAEKVRNALAEEINEGWIDVLQLQSEKIAAEYFQLMQAGNGCIIARGGTYREMSAASGAIPVIEEQIRTADLLQMAADHFAESDDPIIFILHQDMAGGLENLQKLMPNRVRVVRYCTQDEQKEEIRQIKDPEATVVTGGLAEAFSGREDIRILSVQNRDESIRHTAHGARKLMNGMEENIKKVNTFNSVYNNVNEGIIVFRPDNVIIEINVQAEKLLGLSSRSAIGKDVYDLIENMPPKRTDGRCSIDTPTTFMTRSGDRTLNISIYPFDSYQGQIRNMVIVQDVTRIQEAERKIRVQLSKKGLVAEHTFDDIITEDPGMQNVIRRAKRVAEFDGSVLIYGESGTGKELFAQSIHNASQRRNGPFVAINCGALTESLLESELFGYVGGAFTGARKEGKAGLFELAHNGTIFLDEINSTTVSMQTKILRVIEERQVMRVGSDYVIPLDIRIISASNSNLSQDVLDGKFRRDLFFRLNTFSVRIPPIRERKSDIVRLFRYYLKQYSGQNIELDPAFEDELRRHSWLGNVREIRSAAFRYQAFDGDNSLGDILEPDHTGETEPAREGKSTQEAVPDHSDDASEAAGEAVPLKDLSRTVEEIVIKTLEGRGLTRQEIANELGISRQALYKKIKKNS